MANVVTDQHFKDEGKRKFIIDKLFEALQSPEKEVHTHVINILHDLSKIIYPFLTDYLQQLGNETIALIKNDEMQMEAVQALEFWLDICEIETLNRGKPGNLNIVGTLYSSLIEICMTAVKTELNSEV